MIRHALLRVFVYLVGTEIFELTFKYTTYTIL